MNSGSATRCPTTTVAPISKRSHKTNNVAPGRSSRNEDNTTGARLNSRASRTTPSVVNTLAGTPMATGNMATSNGQSKAPAVTKTEHARISKMMGSASRGSPAAAHVSIHNYFNRDRHLNRREIFKRNRSIALAEWRELMV